MINGSTMVCGVIGSPVEHSRSPAIHNAAARATNANLVYTAFHVLPGDAEAAMNAVRSLGLRGLSVTMPHKADVIPFLDELTPVAAALGAVNHVTNTDGKLVGNNTDGEGFVLGLTHDAGVNLDGKRVGVFGSGGAARAIVHACAAAGASVTVVARNPERAEVARSVGGTAAVLGSLADFAHVDVVVNATPIGMAHHEHEAAMPFAVDTLSPGAIVVDAVYNPLETALLAAASNRDLTTVDGLAMLVGQTAAQFTTWTGFDAPFAIMREAAQSG